jgi:hypothetical protein
MCEGKWAGHKLRREADAASTRQNGKLTSLLAIRNRPKVSLRIRGTHRNVNLIYKAVTQLSEMNKVSFHEQPLSATHTALPTELGISVV